MQSNNEVIAGPLHSGCFDAAADASLIRAVATDIEAPDSGYVFGGITAARLRKLADRLALPAFQALNKIADVIEQLPDAEHEIEISFTTDADDTSDPMVNLKDGLAILAALHEARDATTL